MIRNTEGIKITWIGLTVNLILGILKTLAGLFLGSKALVADGMHSLLDLLTDAVVLMGLIFGNRPEDDDHLYGHHKYASLAQLFIGSLLIVFSISLVISAVIDFRQSQRVLNAGWAAVFAILSIVTKEVLFWWTRSVAKRLKSGLLMANAWHHRTDSISSIGVAIALIGVWLGGESWAFLDSAVTLVLGCFLIHAGLKVFRQACGDLLDRAPASEIIEDFREHILTTPGALAYHDFRVRKVGDVYEVDLHLQVESNLTVERGHEIAKEVKMRILEQHPEVFKVLVHIEPANSEHILARGIFEHE